ncbi:ABC transporter permease [Flavihumibacter fluvii]|uniref:ABC transporter permease n=1 Tax=Flavihumibacter fluvii TaxID=2838157 RepID=UPI001BDE006D|nr:FtsX-like permease family protein [Flavihumibacter fluvii]ULQ51601.1 FtsX-like permease family protein [Flavihumibacter fluvii]
MIYLRLAWRNIWRNSRRTWITVASIFFAVILSTFMWAMLEGVYDNMIRNVVAFSSGYLQVHKKGYWEEKSIENVFLADTVTERQLSSIPDVTAVIPRIENFALASTGERSTGVLLLGIDPENEKKITRLDQKVLAGKYIAANDADVMVGNGVARKLRLSVGDSIILLGQGYQASSANGLYRVQGIVQMGSPDLDKILVYMNLKSASTLLNLDNQLSSWALMIDNPRKMSQVKKSISVQLDTLSYEVMDWKEMMPELDQMITADGSGHKITLLVLYLVISFGIFSTILMMLAERQHEFGIMVAIGMKKYQIALIVFMETVMITFIGVLAGSMASLPVIQYFSIHPIQLSGEVRTIYQNYGFEPIIPVSTAPAVFLSQARVVSLITLLIAVYPVYKILNMKLMTALRS